MQPVARVGWGFHGVPLWAGPGWGQPGMLGGEDKPKQKHRGLGAGARAERWGLRLAWPEGAARGGGGVAGGKLPARLTTPGPLPPPTPPPPQARSWTAC